MAVGSTAVLSQILVMLQNLLVARWIGPELNGYVLAGFNAAALGFVLVNWGFDHWLLQQSSMEDENNHQTWEWSCLANLSLAFSYALFYLSRSPPA